MFLGNGAPANAGENVLEALKIDADIWARRLTSREILAGALSELDVVVFPGGSGSRQQNDMGALVVAKLDHFVREEGKGVVGICAGAYLLSDTPEFACLRMCGVSGVDLGHDERGHGLVALSLTDAGRALFPELSGTATPYVYYYEGPLLVPAASGAAFQALATFQTDIHLENGAPAGLMPGKAALVAADVGKGRVVLSAGHPEATPGMRWLVPRVVTWAARRPIVPYNDAVVRPGINQQEILFDEPLRKEEAALFKKLLYATTADKVQAIARLVEIRSWDAPRWIVGCLRSGDPAVRRAAAAALVELETTWALPDVNGVLAVEQDRETQSALTQAAARLTAMTPGGDR